jgi:membrane fusion protein, multidrug efflux system
MMKIPPQTGGGIPGRHPGGLFMKRIHSTHSSIQENSRAAAASARRGFLRRCASLAAISACLATGALLHAQAEGRKSGPGAAGPRAVPVAAVAARLGDLSVTQAGLGTVTALQTVTIRSRVDGQLDTVTFREGQAVRKGDLLAQIDPRPFEVQLHQAEGQLAKDEAALKNARVDLERYKVLIAQDSVPRQQLDTQSALVDQAEASLKSDQAQVESAKLNLTYSRITAPISGVVGLRLVDPGNMVHASDPGGLAVITQQKPIAVLFTLPADALPPILQKMKAPGALKVEAWDRDLKHKLADGSLWAVDNQIDSSTGTVRLKAVFPNEDTALYPNQFVNARLLVDTLRNSVIIPAAAIQRSPQSAYVYVVKPDATAEIRDVSVGRVEGEVAAVIRGLAAGEMVVTEGMDKLQPGTPVSLPSKGEGGKARP